MMISPAVHEPSANTKVRSSTWSLLILPTCDRPSSRISAGSSLSSPASENRTLPKGVQSYLSGEVTDHLRPRVTIRRRRSARALPGKMCSRQIELEDHQASAQEHFCSSRQIKSKILRGLERVRHRRVCPQTIPVHYTQITMALRGSRLL